MKIIEFVYNKLHQRLRKYFKNDTIKHVLSLNFSELKNYLHDLSLNNSSYISEHRHDRTLSYRFVNRYSQLPCTVDTQQKRAFLFEKKGFHNKRILLLGDDDMLSVELSRRYFKNVTVVDCDTSLLQKIKRLTEKAIYPVELVHVDLKDGLPNSVLQKFDVVCFDPPQNSEGFRLFLSWALKALKDEVSFLFVMLNSNIFKQIDLDECLLILANSGYILNKKYTSFNSYPLNISQSFLLRFGVYFLLNKQEKTKAKLNYYFSDCFEFEKRKNLEEGQQQFMDLPLVMSAEGDILPLS